MIKHYLETVANLLFWLLTSWLISSSFSIQSQEVNIENGVETIRVIRDAGLVIRLLVCIGVSAVLFYCNVFNILRLNKGVMPGVVLRWSVFYFLLTLAVFTGIEYIYCYPTQLLLPKSISWGSITFYFTISVAYGIGKVWLHTERQRQQLTIEKKQTELTLLRSQLHPHFLFNALNNLLSLVDQKQNPVLADSLDKLSALLRYVVYDVADEKVPVQKEIDFIRNFANLHALRFEQTELDFRLEINGHHSTQPIEPGIFIPFVENAFKYGVEPEKRSELIVKFDLSAPTRIKFTIVNPIHPLMQQQQGNGSGIDSARARLQLVYPQAHRLEISKSGDFSVELEIETHDRNNS